MRMRRFAILITCILILSLGIGFFDWSISDKEINIRITSDMEIKFSHEIRIKYLDYM